MESAVDIVQSRDELLERLNFVLKSARIGAFDCDLVGGTMLWDAGMHELFGVKPGSFCGKYDDFLALVHFEDRVKLAREIDTVLDKRPEFEVQFRIVRPFDCAISFLKMGAKIQCEAHREEVQTFGLPPCLKNRQLSQILQNHMIATRSICGCSLFKATPAVAKYFAARLLDGRCSPTARPVARKH